jgi:hypothetical protein
VTDDCRKCKPSRLCRSCSERLAAAEQRERQRREAMSRDAVADSFEGLAPEPRPSTWHGNAFHIDDQRRSNSDSHDEW